MSITSNAYSNVTGHDEREAILSKLGVKRITPGVPPVRAIQTAPAAAAQVEAEVERLLLAGKDVPADIAAPVAAAERHDAEQLARVRAINAVAIRYYEVDNVFTTENVEPAFGYLRGELERIMQRAEDAAGKLDGATTAADVLDSSPAVVKAWKALTALAAEYDELRKVQRELTKSVKGTDFSTTAFERSAEFADAIDVHPHWTARRADNALHARATNAQVQAYGKWLADTRPSPAFDAQNAPEYRLALIASTTQTWVPSIDDLDQTAVNSEYVTGAPNLTNIDTLEVARARYYDTTGAEPTTDVSLSIENGEAKVPSLQPSAARLNKLNAATRRNSVGWTNATSSIDAVPIGGH